MMIDTLPEDIRLHVLYPMLYPPLLQDCIEQYPVIDIIVHHPKFDKNTALQYACKSGYLDLVKYFISVGATTNWGIQDASENGHLDVVKYLITIGYDARKIYDWALQSASENGHLSVVKYLASLGANDAHTFEWALQRASWKGHLPIVKYLTSLGTNVCAKNNWALQLACEQGHFEVAKWLIDCGANSAGMLQNACLGGNLDLVKYLVSLGEDVRARDQSALYQGIRHLHIVQYLNLNGADPRAQHDWAIQIASIHGSLDVVKYLVSLGADIHECNNVAQVVCDNGHVHILKYYVEMEIGASWITYVMNHGDPHPDVLEYVLSLIREYRRSRSLNNVNPQ